MTQFSIVRNMAADDEWMATVPLVLCVGMGFPGGAGVNANPQNGRQ
jgi:hypothetical protein